jgi:hypothetical protein
MLRTLSAVLAVALLAVPLRGQEAVSDEHRVKAAYLYNFFKYVEWPPSAPRQGPMFVCVAGRNPFGDVLAQTLAGENIDGRPLDTRIILEPEENCHMLFVPDGAAASAYLRAARGTPTLTVGERDDFIAQGGMISFYPTGGTIRFTINPAAVERANLRISARLLDLAQLVNDIGEVR